MSIGDQSVGLCEELVLVEREHHQILMLLVLGASANCIYREDTVSSMG